jgi:hypothetical protein
MRYRLLHYALLSLFLLLTLAVTALSIRSFWAVDSLYCYAGIVRTPPMGWEYSSCTRWTYGRGYFYCYINNQVGARHPRNIRFEWADVVPPVLFEPTEVAQYGIFAHTRLVGRPFISSYIDPAGRDLRVLEEHYLVPAWVPLSLTSIASVVFFFPARRAWRVASRGRLGLCLTCGYDLRAHQPGEKCPECGTVKEVSCGTPGR